MPLADRLRRCAILRTTLNGCRQEICCRTWLAVECPSSSPAIDQTWISLNRSAPSSRHGPVKTPNRLARTTYPCRPSWSFGSRRSPTPHQLPNCVMDCCACPPMVTTIPPVALVRPSIKHTKAALEWLLPRICHAVYASRVAHLTFGPRLQPISKPNVRCKSYPGTIELLGGIAFASS